MVSHVIVSLYSGPTGPSPSKIPGPLYNLQEVRAIAIRRKVVLWTSKCVRNVADLEWDTNHVAEVLCQLSEQHYKDSEWCENGKGAWAACDAYVFCRKEWVSTARKEMPIRYFIKFAIGKGGAVVLTVSCHT